MYNIVYNSIVTDLKFISVINYLVDKGYTENINYNIHCCNSGLWASPIFIWIDTSNKKYTITFEDIKDYAKLPIKYISSLEELKEIIESKCEKHIDSVNFSFKDVTKPGYIVELKINESTYFGIILDSKTIVYVNKQGAIKGYINNYTENIPYKIIAIYKPTIEHFKLSDYQNMSVVWEQTKPKIKKSKSEIEKELGLEPGTLEIC